MTETPPDNDPDETRSTEGSPADEIAESPPEDGQDENEGQERIGMLDARKEAVEAAEQLLDHPVEDVIKVESNDGDWRVVIEVLEREAIPDTQDILGRYEFSVSATGELSSYELNERYRRDELKEEL
ncbi:MAG: hypothetical protein ACI9EZ_002239 [Halobacteriales archaeon]|jgi:hypothetical protein